MEQKGTFGCGNIGSYVCMWVTLPNEVKMCSNDANGYETGNRVILRLSRYELGCHVNWARHRVHGSEKAS